MSGSPGITGAGQGPGMVACRAGGAGLLGSGAWWGASDWLAVGSLGAPWPALPTLLRPVACQPRAGIRGLLRDLQVARPGVLPAQGLGQVCPLVAAMGEDGRKALGPRLALCAPRLPPPPGSADPLSAGRAPAVHSSGSKGWERRGNRISPFPGLERKLLSHPPHTEGKTGGRESCLAGLWLLPGQGERGSGRGARAWGGGAPATLYCPWSRGERRAVLPINPSSGTPGPPAPQGENLFSRLGCERTVAPTHWPGGRGRPGAGSSQQSESVGASLGPWPAALDVASSGQGSCPRSGSAVAPLPVAKSEYHGLPLGGTAAERPCPRSPGWLWARLGLWAGSPAAVVRIKGCGGG